MSSEANSSEGQNVCQRLTQQEDIIKSRLYGEIRKTVLHRGQGFLKPQWESKCVLAISINKNDKNTGNGSETEEDLLHQGVENTEMILGLADTELQMKVEICLLTMSKGETSSFLFDSNVPNSSQSAKNEEEPVHKEESRNSIDQSKATCLTITLHNFSQAPPSWKLSSEEKYNLALDYKTQGTELFQSGKVNAAFTRYSRAAKYLICIPELSAVSDTNLSDLISGCSIPMKDLRTLLCICHLNMAACQAKVSNHSGVIENCTRALALDSGNVKSLYRRAVANIACGHKDRARTDLLQAQKLEPQNKAVYSLLKTCQL